MTEEEILAEVAALKNAGNRGESEAVDGTAEGAAFWVLSHQPAVTTICWPGPQMVKITRVTAGLPQGPLGPGAPLGAQLIYSA
jgi:hypothetical protein